MNQDRRVITPDVGPEPTVVLQAQVATLRQALATVEALAWSAWEVGRLDPSAQRSDAALYEIGKAVRDALQPH